MSKLAQVNYDELQGISKSLHNESEDIAHLHSATRQKMNALRSEWSGSAADAFFNEMEGKLLPGTLRVSRALNDSETVLNQIMKIIREADEETAGYFKGFNQTFVGSNPHILPVLPSLPWLKGIHVDILGPDGSLWQQTGAGNIGTGKIEPFIGVKIGKEGQLYDGGSYKLGIWDVGAKGGWGGEKGWSLGPYGEFDAFKTERTGVLGSSMFGFTITDTVAAGSVEAFGGLKDNNFGVMVGGSLVSVERGWGINIASYNVRLVGGLAAGVEYGFQFGDQTRIKYGPFNIGLSFGKALTNTATGL